MKKLLLIFICILFLSGCVKTDINIKINNDLSSSININYNYKITDSIKKDEDNTVSRQFKELEKESKKNNYVILDKLIRKKGEFLLKTYRFFNRSDVLSGIFSKELNRIGINNDFKIINTLFSTKMSFNGKIINNNQDSQNQESAIRSYLSLKNTEIFITLPFNTSNHNAKYISNNGQTLQWIVTDYNDNTLFFDGEMTDTYYITIILFALIILTLVVLFILFRNKLKILKRI